MKKSVTKLLACLLALTLLLSAAACKGKEKADPAAPEAEKNGDAIAVSVGDGKYTVTLDEVQNMYDSMLEQYAYFGMTPPTADADIETMQDSVVEELANRNVMLYEAELMGVTLDKNASDGVEADVEDSMAEITANFRAQAESEGAEDVEARTVEIFNERLAAAKMDMDMEGYRAYLREMLGQDALITALETKVKSEVSATAAEAEAYYDDLLEAQKETYAANPEYYLDDQEGYEKFGGDPILVTPEGYIRVKSITITPTEPLDEAYTTLTADMGALEAEYGKLMLTDASENAARLTQIKTEYAEKKAEADTLYEAYIGDARDKADEAHKALADGRSFDETLKAYGQDEVYTTYPLFANIGLLMQKGVASSTWTQAMVDAVDALEPGQYSDVIQADDAFYILSLVGDEPAGETPFGDVEEEMVRLATDTVAETYWREKQEEWLSDASLVTYYEDVYRGVGKDA